MKPTKALLVGLAAFAVSSCGYHLGGVKPDNMKNMNTFAVEMFENNTVQPNVGMLMTTAMMGCTYEYMLTSVGRMRFCPTGMRK